MKVGKSINLLRILAPLLAFAALASCASKSEDETARFSLACGPMDQRAAFLNPIDARQMVKIRYDSRFTALERNGILNAIDDWNNFSVATRSNRPLFVAEEDATVSTSSIPVNKDDCDFATSADGYGVVLVDDDTTWPSFGLSTTANPAVTVRCASGADFVAKQVILVNVRITRAGGPAAGKFQSILKHEIGHSLGLDHSCQFGAGSADYVSCSHVSSSEHPEYYDAVMYPNILSPIEPLNSNDQERAACILGVSG